MKKNKIQLYIAAIVIILSVFINAHPASADSSIVTDCHSATINGYVGLNGSTTASVWFEWGSTPSLGQTTSHQTFYTDSNFSQLITGLTENGTYYYRAMGANDTDTATGDVKSLPTIRCAVQNPTVSLTADNSNISYNGSTILRWSSTNATTCTATGGSNGWSGNKSTYGNFSTGSLIGTTAYSMTCTNSTGSASDSVTVNVTNNQNNIQPSVTISADKTYLAYNENTIIRWYPSNATTCYGSGGSNGWASTRSAYPDSFYTGALTYTTTYTISCSNSTGGSDSRSVTVVVGSQTQNNQQPTVGLTADNGSIPYNGTTFIRWSTTNATTCNASGGSVGWEGPKNIGPGSFYTGSLTSGKTYTITCSNNYGSATDSIYVTVRGITVVTNNPKPTPTSIVLITSSVDRNQPIVPTIDNTRPHPGDEINYTVGYQNVGTGAITGLNLRINLPYEVDYIFSNPVNPTIFGNTLVFNLGSLKANGQGTVTVRVRVRENIPAGTNLNFPAVLSYIDPSGQPQSVTANVYAQVWTDPTVTTTTKVESTNALGASVFGSGAFLPSNLFGWLLLFILILILILLVRYLLDTGNRPREEQTVTTTIHH